MSDFQENCITLSHQDKKLEAVFIHQPIIDAKQAKEYENFVEQTCGALQKFLENSDFPQDKHDKQTKNDSIVNEIGPEE